MNLQRLGKYRTVLLLSILGLLQCSSAQHLNTTCQVKCNSTDSCGLLYQHCACPGGREECSKSELVAINSTGNPSDQCCYCNERGTTCMLNQDDDKNSGINDTATLMIVFFEDCEEMNVTDITKRQFLSKFAEAFGNWTGINVTRRLALWDEVSCTEGEVPNCGVSVNTMMSPTVSARRKRSMEEEENSNEGEIIKSRVRRKLGGGRMRSSSKTKKGGGVDLNLNYNAGYGLVELVKTCSGITVKMELQRGTENELTANQTIALLKRQLMNESLEMWFTEKQLLLAEMMYYGLNNNTLAMIRIPYIETNDGARFILPMDVDYSPFLYAAGSMMGLFMVFVLYKMIKHTIMLKYHKFTRINSNQINTKKVRLPPRSNDKQAPPLPAKTDFTRLPTSEEGQVVKKFDWNSHIYLPRLLDSTVQAKEVTEQQSFVGREGRDMV